VTMGYDRYPELLIEEKDRLLSRCVEQGTRLLLTHDPTCALCAVFRDDRGRFSARDELPAVRDLTL
jgi:hypothetical protein